MVFADPPYLLSNDGLSIQNGQIVSVIKGKWDKSHGFEHINEFNRKWLLLIRDKMKDDATIWISGTMHNIFSIGQILIELGFKILNVITLKKRTLRQISLAAISHTLLNKLFGQENQRKFCMQYCDIEFLRAAKRRQVIVLVFLY